MSKRERWNKDRVLYKVGNMLVHVGYWLQAEPNPKRIIRNGYRDGLLYVRQQVAIRRYLRKVKA